MRTMATLLAALLVTGAQAQDLKVGDTVRGEIALGNWAVRRIFPLPAGDWHVLRVRDVDGTRTRIQDQQALPRSIEVILAQVEGRDLAMLMRIQTLREQTAVRRWTENADPCEQKDKYLHSNAYDSTVWTTKCLTVEQLRGFLGANTSYADVRDWAAAEKVRTPNAPLSALLRRFGDYHSVSVRFWTNPALRKLDLRNEPERKKFVDDFVAWSESYMKLLLPDSPPSSGIAVSAFR